MICAQLLLALMFLSSSPPAQADNVFGVVDGDSIEFHGVRISLYGIDAFELDQSCRDRSGYAWPCGQVARETLLQLLSGHEITCTIVHENRYGSAIARCVRDDGADVGAAMVRSGLALAYQSVDYVDDETAARADVAGAWVGEFMVPWKWRR